jgi:hypothetical protein
MNLKRVALIWLAVMGVLLTVVGLGSALSTDWTTVSQEVAPVIVLIALAAVMLSIAFGRD